MTDIPASSNRQLIEQSAQAADAASNPERKQNAEVLSYDPIERIALVAIDGDEGYGTYAANTTNDNLSPGQRVRVEFRDPHGVEVVGTQSSSQMIGCKWGSLGMTVPNAVVTPWNSGFGATYDPYGIFNPATGVLTVPAGFSGVWSLSMVLNHAVLGSAPRLFIEALTSDGFLYRNAVPIGGGSNMDTNVWSGFAGKFLDGGATATLRTFQNSGASQNFFSQIDFWLTTPGVIQ